MPVGDQPFIDHQLRLLASQGIEQVVICTGYLGEQIMGHVGTGKRFGLEITYSTDGPKPLGTAGAIRKALPMLGPMFGVLYGDTYPLCSLQDVFNVYTDAALMVVHAPGRGNVHRSGRRVLAYQPGGKWRHGDAGFSIFQSRVFYRCDIVDCQDLGEVFAHLANYACLDSFETMEPVYEVGSFEGLAKFREYVLHR